MLWPFAMGVVGIVGFGYIRLQYRRSPFEYNAKPVLSGRITDSASGSNLELRYRAPLWAVALYLVWYSVLALVAAVLIENGWPQELPAAAKAMAVSTIGLMLIGPIGLHAVGTRRSDEDLTELINFLSHCAEATR
jgi:hypothetical protein